MSFKLPDFLNWPSLDALRQKINAPLTTNFSLVSIQSDNSFAEKLLSGGIEINLDEVKAHNDGTLICNGKRVLLHIRDIVSIRGQVTMPKYHLANCQTLEKMRSHSRFGRYVVANRDTGEFQINIIGSSIENQTVKLDICQKCLDMIHWHGFRQNMTKYERSSRVVNFSLTEFFTEYPRDLIVAKPLHTSITAPLNDYSKNWAELSKSIRERRGYQCESCRKVFNQDNSRFLHVHHINGLKYDNISTNLAVLCIACHAQQPKHEHLKKHPDYKLFMENQKC